MPTQPPAPFKGAATVGADGRAIVSFRGRGNVTCLVRQVGCEMAGAAGAIGAIRLNGDIVTPFVSSGDAPGGDPPTPVGPGDVLTVEWTSAPVGAIGKATIFYDYAE